MAPPTRDVPALAQLETMELRFYYIGCKGGIDFMGSLELYGQLPSAPPPGEAHATTFLDEGTTSRPKSGLYMALVGGGEIKDLAHLSPLLAQHMRMARRVEVEVGKREATDQAKEQEKSEGEEKGGEAPKDKKEKEKEGEATKQDKKSEEEEEEEATDEAKEQEEKLEGEEKGGEAPKDKKEKEKEGEATKQDKKSEEEEEELETMAMEGSNKGGIVLSAEVRMLAGTSRAVLVLSEVKRDLRMGINWDNTSCNKIKDRGKWILTRAYCVNHLMNNCEEKLISLISRKEKKAYPKASCFSSKFYSGLVFKGYVFCSAEAQAQLCIVDRFLFDEEIGGGSTCSVYRCSMKSDPSFKSAIKRMEINVYDNEEPREVQITSWLADSSIPTFYQAWIENEPDGSYLSLRLAKNAMVQMELCGRDLKQFLVANPELATDDRLSLFRKVARCIYHLHRNGVTHRDLKPNNFFTGTDGAVKVGDFGQSCWTKDHEHGSAHLGNLVYAAPELRSGLTTEKVDIYSLGAIYLEIFLSDHKPFRAFNGLYDLSKRTYNPKWAESLDVELLKKLTAEDPSDRPSIDEIMDYIGADTLV